jgi:hypothetical protein
MTFERRRLSLGPSALPAAAVETRPPKRVSRLAQ